MKKFSLLLLAAVVTMTACKKDEPEEPEVPNEEEVITTLIYTLTPDGGGDAVVLTYQDLDGEGGNDGTYNVAPLAANASYSGSIQVLNEIEDPAEDITEEVAEEDAEHQFFFAVDTANLTVTYDDADGNGNPVGLVTTVATTDASTGTLTVTLRHEPNKDASGVADGDITNAGGETDIEVTFEITIE